MSDLPIPALDEAVPVLPLPNVVLFPRAVLPLHIFEPRYRLMVRDALQGSRLVAMALLREGYQAKYYTNVAEIHPVVCVGRILSHERLDEGKYNLMLQGLCRARVRQEQRDGPYRLAMLEAMVPREPPADGLIHQQLRQALRQAMAQKPFERISTVRQLQRLIDTELSLGQVADLLAYSMVQEVQVKQQLLEQLDVVRRVEQLLAEIDTLARIVDVTRRYRSRWPPQQVMN
ncbi:MAG: LON peptidase substrate-binding domain-containing protein [Phycisphaerae bacterium]